MRLESGEELPFVIDTGAFVTVIDSSLTNWLGHYRGNAVGGSFVGKVAQDMAVHEAHRLYLGDTLLQTSKLVVATDLSATSRRHPIKGILGMDCLRNYCVQLDFERREIRFLDPGKLNLEDLGDPFLLELEKSPLGGASVYADIVLAGQKARFFVDTGFSSDGDLIFEPALFQRLVDMYVPERTGVNTMFGQATWRVAELSSVTMGGRKYECLKVGEMPPKVVNAPAWMSLRFLARHQVTFNFPQRVMFLKLRAGLASDKGIK
ncbi:MAG: aspartyl protease family protein [Verrucomicrobiota bacterium]